MTLSSSQLSSRKLTGLFLASTMLMTTACGTQGFGVGRNPLGHAKLPGSQNALNPGASLFDGNPEQLASLFLRSRAKAHLAPGQTFPLEVIAIDRQGKLIDPAKLKLVFSSSKNQNVTVDAQGVLTGLIPFETSQIMVKDEKSGASAVVDVTVGPKEYTGNPEALVSLSLILKQQVVPGKGEKAQFLVVAKDILGNPIDPARLRLDWTLSDPNAFSVDKNGEVTALLPVGLSNVLVRDTVTGRITSGTIRVIGTDDSKPTTGTGNANTGMNPNPVASTKPGVPAPVDGPKPGSGPLPLPSSAPGTAANAANIMLLPAVSNIYPGDRVQLQVSITDSQGRVINPASVPLQWSSTDATLPVDNNGVVSAQTENKTTRVTVSIPGTNLSASVIVNALERSSGGGGGGGGGSNPAPNMPTTYSTPLSTSSFDVHITPPTSTPMTIVSYEVTVGNAPGSPTFIVPANGTNPVVAPVPPEALLNPQTTYPYSVVAIGSNGKRSPVINAFGTTLPVSLAPINLIGGSSDFSGVLQVPANTPFPMNRTQGNQLGAGDNSTGETLTVRLVPTAANFGTVSLTSGFPGTVTVTGSGTFGSPLELSGPKADVDEALNFFVYTPQNGFTGDATVTMTNIDTVEGGVTPDDVDTLIFSVASPIAAPPQNFMNSSPTFSNLITAVDTPILLASLNNSELSMADANGDQVTVTLTPANGSLFLLSVPSGVTVTGSGTAASPYVLVGRPYYVNLALDGGLRFTPNSAFIGTGTITMNTVAPDGSDTDSLNIEVLQPSNLYNGSATFPTGNIRMAKNGATTFDGTSSRALGILYPPTSIVTVDLYVTDNAGNNPGAGTNGDLILIGSPSSFVDITFTNDPQGPASLRLRGPVTDINTLLSQGVVYSPDGPTTGFFKLRMDSVDVNNALLTDTADIVNLEVSEIPQNRYANSPTAFPPMNNAIELAHDTPLTFASFFSTALSVTDADSPTVTTTLTPSANGVLTRANTNPIPTGVTVTSGSTTLNAGSTSPVTATNAQPMVITGSPAQINAFLNNGIVFTPNPGEKGEATVTIHTTDGGGEDEDIAYINILDTPENRRNDNANFDSFADILWHPGQEADMSIGDRVLTIVNYPASNTNVEVTLSVPAGKGTLRINGVAGATGTLSSVSVSGNMTREVLLVGTQTNIRTVLQSLRYTSDATAVAAPETVNLTISSTGGTLGDNSIPTPDLVPFLITNPPRNIYRTDDDNTNTAGTDEEDATFPTGAGRVTVFGDQTTIFNNTATQTQPAISLSVTDDSTNVTVTLTPADTTAGTTDATLTFTSTPSNVTTGGAGTNGSPLTISGTVANVQAALALLQYTPETGFTGNTSIEVVSNDGGPVEDTNTVDINVKVKPSNEFNTTTLNFPTDPILMTQGIANPIADDGSSLNPTNPPHEIGVRNLASYDQATDTATVRLQIPNGTLNVILSGGVTVTAGANDTGDVTLSATGPNIPNINTVLGTLTWTPGALADGVDPVNTTLTMTHGPLSDVDTLILLATRPPVNLYGDVSPTNVFPASRRTVIQGTPISYTGTDLVRVGSLPNELEEDSPLIRVTLTPTLISSTEAVTVNAGTPAGVDGSKSGAGTNASPLVLTGTPAAVNTALAALTVSANGGIEGSAQVNIVTHDFESQDNDGDAGNSNNTADALLLTVQALPSNNYRFNGTTGIIFSGTGSPFNVGLNTTYNLDGNDQSGTTNDRPRVSVNFYQPTDTVTVTLTLDSTAGTLSAPMPSGGTVTGNGQPGTPLVLTGTQANVNTALASLALATANTADSTLDMTMTSTNGTVGDSSGDIIRFNVQNLSPVNSLSNTNSGFNNVSGGTPLPLRIVSDTTTVDDRINFGQLDPTAAAATGFTVTANTWPTLSVADDNTSVTTTITPPAFGTLVDRTTDTVDFTGLGLTSISGGGASPLVLVGSPAQINSALLRLSFIPNAGVVSGTSGNITIHTTDGATTADSDTFQVNVERPSIPDTFSGSPNPSGGVFRAIYQLDRDKFPVLTVNDIIVSGKEINDGAQVQILRYNDTDPGTAGFESTTVLRTVTLKSPGTNETVTFNNQTNRATLTVTFNAGTEPVITGIPEGSGKFGGRLTTGGGVDTQDDTDVTPVTHPYHYVTEPDNAIYANEYNTSTGKYYFLNTGTPTTTGEGRLNQIFDSSGSADAQNGTNGTSLATAGLAKDPVTGYVYFIDFVSAGTTGQLIRWRPHFGIIDGASTGDPYTAMTTANELRVTKTLSGNTLTERFDGKPARLSFSSTVNGSTKTPSLYVGSSFTKDDPTGNSLSGFYRIENYSGSGTISSTEIPLIFQTKPFGLQRAYLNNGDIAFEPDTDSTATVGDNHMFISTADRLFVSTNPVPATGNAAVTITEVDLSGIADDLRSNGDGTGQLVDGIVGLSIDGKWTTADPSVLLLVRYVGSASNVANLFRVHYDRTTHAVTSVDLLDNGNYSGKPMVDITSAHLP